MLMSLIMLTEGLLMSEPCGALALSRIVTILNLRNQTCLGSVQAECAI